MGCYFWRIRNKPNHILQLCLTFQPNIFTETFSYGKQKDSKSAYLEISLWRFLTFQYFLTFNNLTKIILYWFFCLAFFYFLFFLLLPRDFELEKVMAPQCSTLAWKIPWTEEPDGLQPMGSRRVGHDWATSISLFTFMHWRRNWQPTPVFLPGESQGRGSLVGCCLWGRTDLDTTEVI